ncbi:regulatory protein RecX [Sanguibacter sp. A247]|uniref:regulatory protein RecX n=1 Tax=unclassified Sanguibacter TaxID=2645534 RepID=UPI003FD8C2E9
MAAVPAKPAKPAESATSEGSSPARPRKRTASAPSPEATEDTAREYLLRSLTASARSRKQLADGLAARDVPHDVAERLLDRFTEVGLIDDDSLAHAIVRSRSNEAGAARKRIALELRRKGIADDIAVKALAQVDDEAERTTAFELARSRAARLSGYERDVALRRLVGFLGRKGYPPGLCFDAARAGIEAVATDSARPD